jgi:hypothetical protein
MSKTLNAKTLGGYTFRIGAGHDDMYDTSTSRDGQWANLQEHVTTAIRYQLE